MPLWLGDTRAIQALTPAPQVKDQGVSTVKTSSVFVV